MALDYKPAPRPSGINNRINEYYQRRNHVRIAKNESSRSLLLAALTPPDYAENGFIPKLITDYENENYFIGENAVGFFDIHAHTATSPMTMRDDNGNMVWGPHNAVKYSTDLGNTPWNVNGMVKGTPNADGSLPLTAAQSGSGPLAFYAETSAQPSEFLNLRNRREIIVSKPVGVTHVLISNNSGSNGQWFNIETKTVGSVVGGFIFGGSLTDLGGGRLLLGYSIAEGTHPINFSEFAVFFSTSENNIFDRTGTEEVTVEAPRGFLADLPMANNPDTGDSYVPTDATSVYLPRRGHNPTKGKKGVLIERAAATNLELNSASPAFDATSPGVVWGAGAASDPNGLASGGNILRGDGSTGKHYASMAPNEIPFVVSERYCLSAFVKLAGNQRYFSLSHSAQRFAITDRAAIFDLIDGVVTFEEATVKATIEDWGGGWFRLSCAAVATASGFTGASYYFVPTNSPTETNPDHTLAPTDGVDIAWVQYEEGSVPSSYVPTQGAAETRDAETLDILNTALEYDAATMSFAMETAVSYDDGNSVEKFCYWEWRASNFDNIRTCLNTSSTSSGDPYIQQDAGQQGGSGYNENDIYSSGLFVPMNVASRHLPLACQNAASGVLDAEAVLVGPAMPAISGVNLEFFNPRVSPASSAVINLFRQWDEDIGDAGLVSATT